MVQIQIDLSEKENKIVEVYQAIFNIKTKEEAVKDIINRFYLKEDVFDIKPRLKK